MTSMIRFEGEAVLPVISFDHCPRAGQPFQADISLVPYYSGAEDVEIKINGRTVPVKNGLAHDSIIIDQSGRSSTGVEILVKNPLTNRNRSYSKNFPF